MDINELERLYYNLIKQGYIIHGTTKEFDKFSPDKIKGGMRGKEGYGFYFSDTPYKCAEYGMNAKLIKKDDFNFIELSDEVNPDYLYVNIYRDIVRLEDRLDRVRNNREYDMITNEIEKLKEKKDEFGYDYFSALDNALETSKNYGNLQFYVRNPRELLPKIAQALAEHGIDGFHDDNIYVVFNFDKLNQNLHDLSEFTRDKLSETINRIVKKNIDKTIKNI